MRQMTPWVRHDRRFAAGDSVLVHIIEGNSQTIARYAGGKPTASYKPKVLSSIRKRLRSDLEGRARIFEDSKNDRLCWAPVN